ncbi:MAG: tetratricopeptide repeat protein [Alphaproteobacteria bacterium]|nr:tetratricopeptide repeat protein [Alphaproteobacteria bacterium]MBV9420709.1 tetratricopeptide repeat protein [Alphaproteobacteria bacterium]
MLNPLAYLESPIGILSLILIGVCIVHAIRRGNIFPWIYIIVFLPAIGSLIYLVAVIIPELFRSRGAAQLGARARQMADPNKSFREAHRAAEMIGSVDAKRALAEEYIARGNYTGAVEIYREAAQGQFKDDPALLHGLARAQFLSGDAAGAQATLDALQSADPSYVSGDAHLLYARALEAQGKENDALVEYRRLVPYFSGEEARARFGQLLLKTGNTTEAREVFTQVLKSLEGAPPRYQKAQKEWGDIARRGLR